MRPNKLLLAAIITFLAVTASVANAAPLKGKTYTVQDTSNTRWNQQDRFHIGY
jgi:hypothetical protein